MSRRTQWVGFTVGLVLIAFVWLAIVPSHVQWKNGDQIIYERTVTRMQAGENYYPAAAAELGPQAETRAFRTPTIFWVWAATGTFSWPATLIVIMLTATIVAFLSWPLAGLAVGLWLVGVTHPLTAEQWGYNEVWALPLVLGAVWAIRRGHWTLAVLAILAAAIIRETAVLFLIGGGLAALRAHRPVSPWLAAGLAWFGFIAWHAAEVTPYLRADGAIPAANGPGIGAVIQMCGPWLGVVAPAIVGYALWARRGTPEWWLVAPALVLVPLAGLSLFRPYWGYLVLPLAVTLLGSAGLGFSLMTTRVGDAGQ